MKGKAGLMIKGCREVAGMTQTDLAKRVGMARGTLASYESGYAEPSYERVEEIASVCGFELTLQKKRVAWK